jgi:3-hydroxybutyryl-CoA dehydrogenase
MEIKTIAVLGAGQMGAGIAQIAATNGYKVIMRDIKQEFCDKGVNTIKSGLDRQVAKGKTTQEAADAILANISTTVELEGVASADFVIEAVPEIMSLKQDTFKQLGEICREDAILVTNTSSMSITEITGGCKNPERCMGMHFFSPVYAMKLIEMIRSDYTSDATVEAVREVSKKMGKVPVLCQTDTPGFIVNRCLFAFMLEAVHCYEVGVASIDDIDTAIKLGLNHPMGPFEMMDLSGLDTFPHVTEILEKLPVTDWSAPKSLLQKVEEGKYGRKSGEGWHKYN